MSDHRRRSNSAPSMPARRGPGPASSGSRRRASSLSPPVNTFNADTVREKRVSARTAELKRMQNTGLVADRTFDLMRTRFRIAPGVGTADRPHLEHAFSMQTRSASHNMRVMSVASDLLGNMMHNAVQASQVNMQREESVARGNRYLPKSDWAKPAYVTDPTRVAKSRASTLGIDVHRGRAPHFAHATHSISLMNPDLLDQTAHETQHAYDHIRGDVDLRDPRQRIASELNAHVQQAKVAFETTGKPPPTFFDKSAGRYRSPVEMAQSYEGKTAKGYEGTLESSLLAVEQHRAKKG